MWITHGIRALIATFILVPASHATAATRAGHLSIEVAPAGRENREIEEAVARIVASRPVQGVITGTRYRVLGVEPDYPLSGTITVPIYDYTNDRLVTVTDSISSPGLPMVLIAKESTHVLPTQDEFDDAVAILSSDPQLGADVRSGKLVPYQAMPPMLDPLPGSGQRVIPVGLRPTSDDRNHETVAVDLSFQKVERFTRRAAAGSIATAHTCGPPSAGQSITRVGTSGSATITVKDGGTTIWKMQVTRPSASAGRWGSGVELKEIEYRGRKVMHRAHVPILNVDYDNDVCGPYRDQVNHENSFIASGRQITSGIIQADAPPSTIYDTNEDRGNFRGVAISEGPGKQLVLTSELSAGWYRYASEFRFDVDGTIRPIFKFSAVHNSCTCAAHNHHVYWRFDVDVDAPRPNSVQVAGPGGWRDIPKETKFVRDANHLRWRMFNSESGAGFEVIPGPYDGSPNAFGKGDVWVVKQKSREIDDYHLGRSKDAKIDAFLNDESVAGEDIVFWYAGHIRHFEGDETPHIAAPVFKPFGF